MNMCTKKMEKMEKVWLVEYIKGNSGEGRVGYRLFRKRDDAFREKFEVDYDFFKNELESDIKMMDKCRDPEVAKKYWRSPTKDDFGINLCNRALAHIERVKNMDISWEEKMEKLWESVIPWDDVEGSYVNLGSTCCTNLAPDVFISELELE